MAERLAASTCGWPAEVARALGDVGAGISPYPFVLIFPQDDHERLLIDRLRAPATRSSGRPSCGFEDAATASTARLKRRTARRPAGAYLGGCDGAHAVREAWVGFPGGTYDQLFYVADAEADGPWSDRRHHVCLGADGLLPGLPGPPERGMFRFIGIVPEALRGRDDITFDDLRGDGRA